MSSIIDARVRVTLDPPDTEKYIGNSASIRLDDGIETPIHLQGHGVQRSLVFALLEVIAKTEAAITRAEGEPPHQRAIVLLFEEPELYMHPHLMRRLKKALKSIAQSDNWQVIISTHSPFLLDVANDPKSLVIFHKNDKETQNRVKQLSADPFTSSGTIDHRMALRASLDFHPTVAEAFFAERVVLVEGDTEVAVLTHEKNLVKLAGIDSKKADHTTVISCGGKWTIPAMATLLTKFEIPFRIIHDTDKKDRSDEQLEKLRSLDPYRANQRIKASANDAEILMIDDTFEDVLWENKDDIPDAHGSGKPYRAWCRVEELCNGKDNLDHALKLKDVVIFAFDW